MEPHRSVHVGAARNGVGNTSEVPLGGCLHQRLVQGQAAHLMHIAHGGTRPPFPPHPVLVLLPVLVAQLLLLLLLLLLSWLLLLAHGQRYGTSRPHDPAAPHRARGKGALLLMLLLLLLLFPVLRGNGGRGGPRFGPAATRGATHPSAAAATATPSAIVVTT
jgi:hypothetical protein